MSNKKGNPWWVVIAVSLPLIMLTIDFFGIAVAMPTIGRELGTDTATLAWVINGFMLGFAAPLVAVGRFGDLLGRRKILLLGLFIFVGASILCGLSDNIGVLIAGRALQGIGAGMSFANSLSIVSNSFPTETRGLGIGVWTGVGTIGSALGPMVGGFLTEALSWRWFFFVNIPIGVVALIMTLLIVEESRDEEAAAAGIDWTGFLLITFGAVLFLFALQSSSAQGWTSNIVLIPLIVSIVVLALFGWVETRVKAPLMDFELFNNRDFLGSAATGLLANFGFGAMMFFLTLYLQHILDLSPLRAGAVFLAFSIPMALLSPLAGKLLADWGARKCMGFGMALVTLAFLAYTFVEEISGVTFVIAGLLIMGVGQGFAYNISTAAAMISIPEKQAGAASGTINMVKMMALPIGVAVGAAIFGFFEHRTLSAGLAKAGAKLDPSQVAETKNLLSGSDGAQATLTKMAPAIRDQIDTIVDAAFTSGFVAVMATCAALSAVGFGFAFVIEAKLKPDNVTGN